MIERALRFSINHRFLILLFTFAAAAIGALALLRLPIDAVPDITNNQVQINTLYPAFSPLEVEKQITFPIETALAGIAGLEYTRSLSRNGFSQVTAVFSDNVDIYFARQQVGERLIEARESLPVEAEPRMGPISTGLGEIYMWTVEYKHPDGTSAVVKDGEPGWQQNGNYLTPEGIVLATPLERAAYLREIQDWIIRPQLRTVAGVAGVDAIGGYVKHYAIEPDPSKLIALNLTFEDLITALERNNLSTGAGYIEHRGESYIVRAASRIAEVEPKITVSIAATPEEVLSKLRGLDETHDFVIADGPGGLNDSSRTLLILSDLAIFPISPSILDLRSVSEATEALKYAQSINGGKTAGRLVLNRMRTRDKISRELKDAAPSLGVDVAMSHIRDLQPYRDAAGQGTVVTRMGRKGRDAAQEITQLFVELMTDKLTFLERKPTTNENEGASDERATVAK